MPAVWQAFDMLFTKYREAELRLLLRAYQNAFEMVATTIPGLHVAREVVAPGSTKRLDLLLTLTQAKIKIRLEFVAHERVGTPERAGSVKGHIERLKTDYNEIAANESWLINFVYKDKAEQHFKVADPDSKVNVLHVVVDPKSEKSAIEVQMCLIEQPLESY